MSRRRNAVNSELRLSDLFKALENTAPSKLLSIKLPVELLEQVDRVRGHFGAGKAEMVTALLNEGLARYAGEKTSASVKQRRSKHRRPAKLRRSAPVPVTTPAPAPAATVEA